MASSNYKMFMCFTRKFKISELQPPADVVEGFAKYAGGPAGSGKEEEEEVRMTASQLQRFLVEFQGEQDQSRAEAESDRIINQVNSQGLTLDDFFQYLFSDDLNGPINTEVHHDMTAPMQHYFIFTGHNSYLTGNQLSSDCSDVPIIKALKRGVRVIELDLWPNSSKDDINVNHGRTLTTPVRLIKCLTSIKEHAFERSPYPLVITLEDHLTPDLQAKVAKMVTEIFGDMLYYPDSEHFEEFPSPEELKHRIILSTKPPKEYLESKTSISKDKQEASLSRRESRDSSEGDPSQASGEVKEDEQSPEEASDSDSEEAEVEGELNHLSAPEYKRLIALRAGKPKNGLREALRTGFEKIRRLSLNEQEIDRAATNYGTDVVRFTQKNFLRIYPKGTRIRSSNYNPVVAWTHGAQMVAGNMQGYDRSLWLMHGMFRSNGGCGYVKKPEILINNELHPEEKVFDPKAPMDVKTTLKVRVYMGDGWRQDFSQTHFDTYSPPDFYTKLRIVGVPEDCDRKKTRVIDDDWVPIWDEEFSFTLTVPELALLKIEVREHDLSETDDFGGQICLPVSEIRPGIRAVPLFDKKGEKLPSVRLLMRFEFVPGSTS